MQPAAMWADLTYLPVISDLDAILDVLPHVRVLLLGKGPDLDGRHVDARRYLPPGAVLSTGLYVFRGVDGWDVIACSDGIRPGPASSVNEGDVAETDFLVQARSWFDHFWPLATPVGSKPLFAAGDHVQLAGTERVARVESLSLVGDEWVYDVTVDRLRQSVSEAGLQPLSLDPHDPLGWVANGAGTARQFGVAVTHTKLANPLTDTIYSYLSSKTVFRPYQFRPVLRFLSSSHQRLLIADEVGLGKTIEAGLIWTELEQRNQIRRVLVVCPAGLVPKWQSEMRRRFDRELRPLDRAAMSELIAVFQSGEEDKEVFAVVSVERLRKSRLLADLAESEPRFDLIIVDEAHVMRNAGTVSHALGRLLSDWADALIFLSATPLNLGHDDLFNLLNLLVEDEFADRQVFPLQIEPNRYLNDVASRLLANAGQPRALLEGLDRVAGVQLGGPIAQRPEFSELRSLLAVDRPLAWGELVAAKRCLAELNTLSSIVTRTRKVDVPDAKAVREPVQIDVEWTPKEKAFYRAVLTWARARAAASGMPSGFVTQMPLRQAASCLPAMRELLAAREPALFAPGADEDFDEFDEDVERDVDDPMTVNEIRSAVAALGDVDTKYDRFVEELEEARRNGLRQAMVFSFFRRTLAYLERRLRETWTVRVMHGGTKMADRIKIMDDFRSGDFEILLVSEVGSEGLDFEFCNVLVNYDLPWNPMRVEQRIGRLDRFGQTHEKIHIYNFHVPGTIETDIFERLYNRINVFRESIGELEPILREDATELQRIALDPRLSDDQRRAEVDRLEVALEERRRQLDDLRVARSYMAGVDQLLIDGFEEDTHARGRFVGPNELEKFLGEFFADGSRARFVFDRTTNRVEVIGDAVLAERIARRGGVGGATRYGMTELARLLRDEEPVHATFSNEEASKTSLDLISIRHPFVKAAVRHFGSSPYGMKRYGAVRIVDNRLVGEYVVVIYLAETTGVRPSLEMWPIAVHRDAGDVVEDVGFAVLAAVAEGRLTDGVEFPASQMRSLVAAADAHVRRQQLRTEGERRQQNEALVDARREAQRASFEFKIARAEETLALVERDRRDKSLQRLYRGRIVNLHQRMEDTLSDLEARRNLALAVRPVAVAALTVEGSR